MSAECYSGIWQANCQNLFGKIDFVFSTIRFSDPISVLKVFFKNRFLLFRGGYTPYRRNR